MSQQRFQVLKNVPGPPLWLQQRMIWIAVVLHNLFLETNDTEWVAELNAWAEEHASADEDLPETPATGQDYVDGCAFRQHLVDTYCTN